MRRVLAGDVGGTHARLAYFEVEGTRITLSAFREFSSRTYSGLAPILAEFLREDPRPISSAAFGVAGPVVGGRSEIPNLTWRVDGEELASLLALDRTELLNDLAANAYGIAHLTPDDVEVLHAGKPQASGHIAVISAGTGLGQAGLFWDGTRHRPFASEGGHCDFAPRDAMDLELWAWLARKGHVSYERVLSGPGLVAIYGFLRETGKQKESPEVAAALQREDPAAVIARHGLARSDALSADALDHFVGVYGAAAGNVALQFFATGGVYVGGGIAPKIRDRMKEGGFVSAFVSKGRMRPLLEEIPVKLIVNDKTALWGAAHVAAFGF